MLESHVYNSIGEKIDLKTHLNGKTLGLYFAGRWSSACKTFMPILTSFYKSHGKAKKFEIVFISSDESLEEFKMNFADMPWLALSYDQRHIKVKALLNFEIYLFAKCLLNIYCNKAVLSEKFNVTGIPLLIIINSDTGDIINLDARLSLELDKEGVQFPWKVEDAMRKKHSLILNKPLSYEPIQDFNSSSLITKKGFKF